MKVLKQKTEMGCLTTCYNMIQQHFGNEIENEAELNKQAFSFELGFNELLYLKKFDKSNFDVKVLVESPYLEEEYKKVNSKFDCNIKVKLSMIGLDDFESLLNDNYIIITSIDMWHLNMIVHLPHYVIVNSFDENSFYIIDPKYGKEIKFSKDKFLKSIDDLKYRLGYSPIIFAIKKETV